MNPHLRALHADLPGSQVQGFPVNANDPLSSKSSSYAWFADDELLTMMNRYVERAPSAELASTRLKVWLGQQCLDQTTPQASPRPLLKAPKASPASNAKAPPRSTVTSGQDQPTARIKMTRAEAAIYLGRSASTLANWAYQRIGPPYYRKGGIHYFQDELDAWLAKPAFEGE